MKTLLRLLGIGFLLVVVVAGGAAVAARFNDGPIAIFAGGPFTSGEPVDLTWHDASFLQDVEEIEFQLEEPARSRITWVVVQDRVAYIPCGMPEFRIWKQWPHEAVQDGRAIVRFDGKLHRRELVKVDDPALEAKLRTETGRKYGIEDYPGEVWFFRIEPRRSGPAAERR